MSRNIMPSLFTTFKAMVYYMNFSMVAILLFALNSKAPILFYRIRVRRV